MTTLKPRRANSVAAARPAGPPPITNTSGLFITRSLGKRHGGTQLRAGLGGGQASLHRASAIHRHQTPLASAHTAKIPQAQAAQGRAKIKLTRANQGRGNGLSGVKQDRVTSPGEGMAHRLRAIGRGWPSTHVGAALRADAWSEYENPEGMVKASG